MSSLLKHRKLSYLLPLPLGMLLPLQYKLWTSFVSDFQPGPFAGIILPLIFMVFCLAEYADNSSKYKNDAEAFFYAVLNAWISCAAAQIVILISSAVFPVTKELEGDLQTVAVIIVTACGYIYSAVQGFKLTTTNLILGVVVSMVSGWIVLSWILIFSVDPIGPAAALLITSLSCIPGYALAYYIRKDS